MIVLVEDGIGGIEYNKRRIKLLALNLIMDGRYSSHKPFSSSSICLEPT